jgi:tetratricopeptide (TPR) repeat protein
MKTLTFRSLFPALVLIAVAPYSGGQTVPGYDALIAQGNALLQTGNADQALKSGEAAIKARADRWEGYSLAGGALLNLKRYEDAADALSKAIDRAPESKQPALRAQRRECLLAESGYPPSTNTSPTANTSAPAAGGVPAPGSVPATGSMPATGSVPATTGEVEIVLWKSIENSHNAADFQNYLSRYPHGAFVDLARSHLADAEARLESDKNRLAAKLTWSDPASGLIWARYSRPSEYSHASFRRATDYCAALRSLGYADWRLPTLVEFTRVYHFTADSATVRLDGELSTNKEILPYLGFWTSTPGSKDGEHVLVFEGKSVSSRDDEGEGRVGGWAAGHRWNGAIVCVRDQKDAEHR